MVNSTTNRILVAIADCEAEEYLFDEATRLAKAKQTPTELFFLHVLPDGTTDKKVVGETLQMWADKASAMGIKATAKIDYGMPGRIICQHAGTPLFGANYIVAGHRVRNALTELAMGSVSTYIRDHAPVGCAVLIVRPAFRVSTAA